MARAHAQLTREGTHLGNRSQRLTTITGSLVALPNSLLRPKKNTMIPSQGGHSYSATTPSKANIFERDLLPLRAELERAARRYVRNPHDAQDLVQETFAKAWAAYDSFDPDSNGRAWMHRILVNTWISAYRRTERRPHELLTDSFTDADLAAENRQSSASVSAEARALQRMPNDQIRRAMQKLPQVMQEVVYYADVYQYTYKEIAELWGIPVGTVMSRIHRARARLREALCEVARGEGYTVECDPGDVAA
jgi:RNA polymerase sigma-70 factor (ECF subfamily)